MNRMLVPLSAAYMGFSATMDGNPDDFFAPSLGFAAGLTVARPTAEIGQCTRKTLKWEACQGLLDGELVLLPAWCWRMHMLALPQ